MGGAGRMTHTPDGPESDYRALDDAMEILGSCAHTYTGEQAQRVAKRLAQWQRKWAAAAELIGCTPTELQQHAEAREHRRRLFEALDHLTTRSTGSAIAESERAAVALLRELRPHVAGDTQ